MNQVYIKIPGSEKWLPMSVYGVKRKWWQKLPIIRDFVTTDELRELHYWHKEHVTALSETVGLTWELQGDKFTFDFASEDVRKKYEMLNNELTDGPK